MKRILIIFIGLTQFSFSQDFEELRIALKKELPVDSNKDGRWVFEEESAEIEKIENTEVQKRIPQYELYKVLLTNYLGYHINDSYCLILFDQKESEVILIEPVWYSGINSDLLKMFVGIEFEDKDSILKFIFSLQDIMIVGSTGLFENTKYQTNKITFDLTNTPYRKNSIWRNIEIGIDKNKIVFFKSINPATGDIVKVK